MATVKAGTMTAPFVPEAPRPPEPPLPEEQLYATEAWVFDLDNTLYPPRSALFAQIDERMRGFIGAALGLDPEAAFALQKRYFREYGTSLRGLMEVHDIDPRPFLDHVHEIDLSPIDPDPLLNEALGRLPGRKLIFTNASVRHAERVLERLGIAAHFEAIFDVEAAGFHPKPAPAIYATLVRQCALEPSRSVMIDDIARNLQPAAALGMTTVWLRNDTEHGLHGADGDYIHHVIDDVTEWLVRITSAAGTAPVMGGIGRG
jgi:putative hydrolase of the HAD superfamily